ncbi:MAG TPA: radical SAM protein [Spirochaetota bacterium]|nr:radical SAM protein [Spirochaetota bacterium]
MTRIYPISAGSMCPVAALKTFLIQGTAMTDYTAPEPFEICSIRPPTENSSITFRLTRNCHWNRCAFCPVYKLGAKYSRRTLDEVKADIDRAKALDDLLFDHGIGTGFGGGNEYRRAAELIDTIKAATGNYAMPRHSPLEDDDNLDDRSRWFLSWFRDVPTIEDSVYHLLSWRLSGGQTCFLGDADSLVLKPDFLKEVIAYIKPRFPTIQRFTIYGRTRTAARQRSLKDLHEFRKAGLDRVHFGLESGCDEVLSLVNKGVTAAEHIEGCLKVKDAGLSCSVYVMPGLGGSALSVRNAADTARVLTAIGPDFIRIRSLEIFPRTPLEEMRDSGGFTEASEVEVVREIRTLVEHINCDTQLLSDSASNLLAVNGDLPDDRKRMLGVIDAYLAMALREKLEFSLRSRLESFLGQYGGPTEDIIEAIRPMLKGSMLEFSRVSDGEIVAATRLIRGKLMP